MRCSTSSIERAPASDGYSRLEPFAIHVRMGVDEPGHDGAAAQIDEARGVARQAAEICTGADFRDAVRGDRDGLGDVEGGIEGDDVTAVTEPGRGAHEQ